MRKINTVHNKIRGGAWCDTARHGAIWRDRNDEALSPSYNLYNLQNYEYNKNGFAFDKFLLVPINVYKKICAPMLREKAQKDQNMYKKAKFKVSSVGEAGIADRADKI